MKENDIIKQALADTLNTLQRISGRPECAISDQTCPFYDLAGFDSHNALEAVAMMGAKLGCDIPPTVFGTVMNKPPTVANIIRSISQVIAKKEKENEG